MDAEKLELKPPIRDDSNIRVVDGVLVTRCTAHRHAKGESTGLNEADKKKKHRASQVPFKDASTGKIISRSTDWRRRTAVAKLEKDIENGVAPLNKKIAAIEEEFGESSDADRLRSTYKELVRRLSVESHSKFITEVIWDDPISVNRRKSQMANLKDLLSVTKSMMELVEKLEADRLNNNEMAADERRERMGIINAAETLLKRENKK
jgi:hypothetical protein